MDINDILNDAGKAPLSTKLFYEKAFDVVDRIHELLEQQGLSQKDLAKKLGKSPSEVSKWLTGQHNLTLKTIAAMEAVLGEQIVITPDKCGEEPSEEPEYFRIGDEEFYRIQAGSMVIGVQELALSRTFRTLEVRKISLAASTVERKERISIA